MAACRCADQVGLALKDVLAKAALEPAHLQDVVCDLLWLLGEEAAEGKEGKDDLKSAIAPVFKEVIASGVSSDAIKSRVAEETLEAAGLIKSAQDAKGRLQRLRTNKVYSQQKFNLLREESEGYSKLVVGFAEAGGGGGKVTAKDVALLTNSVMSLIAYFNLDPNRVLDVMLDCLEAAVLLPEASLEGFVHLIRKFNGSALVKVLGFKFQGYQQAAQNPPESLYQLVAVLCRHKALVIDDIYPLLSPSDDEMVSAMDKHYDRLLKFIKGMRVFKTSSDDADKKGQDTLDAAPHAQTGDDNQKLHILAALLTMGDWPSARHLLTNLAQLLPASFPPVAAGFSKLISEAIAPVYAEILRNSGLASVVKGAEAARGAPGDGMDVDGEEGAAAGLPVIREAAHLPRLAPILQHLSVYIGYDPILFMKVARVVKEYLQQTAKGGRDEEFVKGLLQSMVAGLVLLPRNASAANYVWECIKELPYLDRYWIYSVSR